MTATPRFSLKLLDTGKLVIAILFILLFALAVRVPVDTDTWWHLRSGEYTLSNRVVPQTDPFSLTRGGQEWINQSWLSQLVLVGFYRGFAALLNQGGVGGIDIGGSAGLAFYTALLATAGMAFVFATCPGNAYLRGFIAILSASTAAVFWSARPQMMSFLLSTVTLYLLDRYKRHGENWLWILPPLMVLWVNLHSGFAIGFILIGAFIGGEIISQIMTSKAPETLTWRGIGILILIAVLCVGALVINPYGVTMLTYPFRTAGIGSLQAYIQEWNSPDFKGRETWPFLILLFGTMAAAGFSKRGWDWTDLALVSGTAFLSLIWQRNFSVFAVAAAPVLARHLDTILVNQGWVLRRSRPVRGGLLILNWVILGLVLLGACLKIYVALNAKTVTEAQAEFLPVRAAAYLNTARPAEPLFNTYNWGGYLLFTTPQYKVFVDGRTDLYDDLILTEWRLTLLGQNWEQTFQKYGIRLVVIEKDVPLVAQLQSAPGWRLTYSDSQAVIFERMP